MSSHLLSPSPDELEPDELEPEPFELDRTHQRTHELVRAAQGPGGPGDDDLEHEGDTEVADDPDVATPRRFKVLFHNDDFTTMEFVVEVLIRFFRKTETEAMHVMLTVHKTGAACVLVTTKDVAETKAAQVMDYARENGMPLLVTTEPE